MKICKTLLFLFISFQIFAQTDIEKAQQMLEEAVEIMDNGDPDKAIGILKKARTYDAKNYIYDYEIAYALYLKHDFKEALKTMKYVTYGFSNITDQCYQLLGNLYDISGNSKKAVKTYDEGLKKFPNSGRLYLEKGIVYLIQKKYIDALTQFEQGIKVEPTFPSNYYRATQLYCSSSEAVWGMIYGELFMNLERNTRRTDEISNLLYTTYLNKIEIKDKEITVQFSANNTIYVNAETFTAETFKLPFGVGFYEPAIVVALIDINQLNMSELSKVRDRFLVYYEQEEVIRKYKNALFDHHLKMREYGHFEAYTYWILMMGNEKEFDEWHALHQEEWQMFVEWFGANPMRLDVNSIFHRYDY
jgi:tetratricopeptide (TPR) repeat protein